MTEFQKYIQRYLDLIPSDNWLEEMINSGAETIQIFSGLNNEKSLFAYAEGKWTLKELLQHLIDAERIFAYRALRFARKDRTELVGWDEETYAKHYFSTERSLQSLTDEFKTVRKSSSLFFENLNLQISNETIQNKIDMFIYTYR